MVGYSINVSHVFRSMDSSVSVVTGYGLYVRGSISSRVSDFCFPQRLNRLWGPPSCLSNGLGALSLGIKRTESETDHSFPSSAKFRNGGDLSPLSHTS